MGFQNGQVSTGRKSTDIAYYEKEFVSGPKCTYTPLSTRIGFVRSIDLLVLIQILGKQVFCA